ncbi:MAG: DNA gyrase subunit A [Desulfomonile tiedjei]|uniref:DNA gyrase subunit A n=1 Tax=Desulfomonile tiedjei TaxID=2358 RepID=A0A9D6V7V7_9BACT|nr:DNA gyrase subunit A [Desulfomonile tiedjei]
MAVLHDRTTVGIEEEIQKSYLDYAMSVIVGRALPELRDGLKPVHRRILYAMFRAGNLWNRGYRKAARAVGDVIGQYHPHGDVAVYDSIVRMAQPFSMRYLFVDGQGNFGSVDGDSAAAMRYTEVRMHRICQALLEDLDKETVDFAPNYDNTQQEPLVLPARFPVLLVIGSQGIAVGMATNIPPHNLGETIDATIHLINQPDASIRELMQFIPAPDFPTAGFILGTRGAIDAYTTGRGSVRMRARTEIEDAGKGYQRIVVTEIPYLVNKARMVENVADLVKDKRITGIRDIRDESNRQGIRVVFELKKDETPEVVLNQLFRYTQLQTNFGIQLLCVDNGRPRQMNLKEVLQGFIDFRREVVIRRTRYELARARERAHILEGLRIALDNLDRVIAVIRGSENPATAKQALMDEFSLSALQAQAILDMRLQRLTGLERDKILQELQEVLAKMAELEGILASEQKIMDIIVTELKQVKEQFGDARRSEIVEDHSDMLDEDLIPRGDMVVTFSSKGYVKRVPANLYKTQRPGGKGRIGTKVAGDDVVNQILYASSHDVLLCFSNRGRVHWMRVFQLPEESPYARGKAIINLLRLDEGEKIRKILPVQELSTDGYVVMVSKKGKVKKTLIAEFSRPRLSGLIALTIDPDDELIDVNFTTGENHILLATTKGLATRFHESQVRAMGRQARGVTGIRLKRDDVVMGMEVISDDTGTLLTITRSGFGKRTSLKEYPPKHRGGLGVITIKNTAKLGDVVGIQVVGDSDHLLILTSGGRIIRLRMEQISVIGRNTMGRTLVRMDQGEHVVDVARAETSEDEDKDPDEIDSEIASEMEMETDLDDSEEALETDEESDEES